MTINSSVRSSRSSRARSGYEGDRRIWRPCGHVTGKQTRKYGRIERRLSNFRSLRCRRSLEFQHSARKPKLIFLSEDKHELVQALKLGCSGVVLKRSATEDILKCIRRVYAGEIWVDCQIEAFALMVQAKDQNGEMPGRCRFSRREREILTLVGQGFTNSEIAGRLHVSTQTVKNHLHHMFDKIGATDRLELELYSIHEGLQRERECDRAIHRGVRRKKEPCLTSLA
jgi:two-component system, NarL family, nitrate/nitrite response regulator NarL